MSGNHSPPEKEAQHAINIWEVNKDRLSNMQQKLYDAPKLLSVSAGGPSCSIFRVPQSLMDINGRSYQPHIVSVGPYHHGHPNLKMIEEHKWRFLNMLLNRTKGNGLSLEDYLKAVQKLETRARECYSETIDYDRDGFVEMLVLDGCFIIELFRIIGEVITVDQDDPLISMSWIFSFFLRDLIRLENQIPFFVLRCLFDLTRMPGEESGPSLATLTLNFFNYALQRPKEHLAKYGGLDGKHLLDFLRSSFLPEEIKEPTEPDSNPPSHVIHSISKLRRAGIELKAREAESFLVVGFKRGVIYMPTLAIDDFTSAFMLNCVAFEQCHGNCPKYMTTYVTLLDCLANSARDVEYLSDKNIIENYYGTDAEVARFLNNMGKDISFDIDLCYLAELFDDVNRYYASGWHVQWASFKYTYFDTPWSFISALAAFVLLVLTVAQTYFTIISYVLPR